MDERSVVRLLDGPAIDGWIRLVSCARLCPIAAVSGPHDPNDGGAATMTDKEYADLKGAIEVFSERWRARLGLRWWKVNYTFDRTGEDFADAENSSDGSTRTRASARTSVRWPYLIATVAFNMPALAELSLGDVEELLLHEHVHILVAEMREDGIDHEERVVTTLTSAFLWTRDMVLQEAAQK